jgi:hypothetical protein
MIEQSACAPMHHEMIRGFFVCRPCPVAYQDRASLVGSGGGWCDPASGTQGVAHLVWLLTSKKPQVTEAGDDLVSRARYLMQVAEVEGKSVGRGTLSRELEIPENQARQRLAEVRQSDT